MPDSLTPGDGQDLLKRYKRAWEKRDPERMMDLYAEDARYRIDPFDDELSGANAIRARWNELAATQAQVDFDSERIWISGRTVLSSWHGAFTRREDAERIRVRGFSSMEIDDDGRIARQRDWPIYKSVGKDTRTVIEPLTGGEDDG